MQTRRDSKQLHGFKTTTKRCKNLPQTDKATDRHQTTTNNNYNNKDTRDDHKETMNTETQNWPKLETLRIQKTRSDK